MDMELVAQVGAVVGTSALLYYITKPRPQNLGEFSDPTKLEGCFRYSHYHRQRLSHSLSSRSESKIVDDQSSSSSVSSNVSRRSRS